MDQVADVAVPIKVQPLPTMNTCHLTPFPSSHEITIDTMVLGEGPLCKLHDLSASWQEIGSCARTRDLTAITQLG